MFGSTLGHDRNHQADRRCRGWKYWTLRKSWFWSAVIALGLCQITPAIAQRSGLAIEVPDIRNFAGLGVGLVPDYFGSDEYTLGVAPTARFQLGNSDRYIRLLANELSANFLDNRNWQLGPVVLYRFGRDDVDDDVVGRMRDIENNIEMGIVGGWTWIDSPDPRHRFNVSAQFLQDVSSEHDGYVINASARYWRPVSRSLTLSIGVATAYGSDDYSSTYFGVDAADSAASGLPIFKAEGGIRDVRISPMLVFSFNESWHLGGGFIYSRLLGDAADSPVVDTRGSKNRFIAGIGLVYAW